MKTKQAYSRIVEIIKDVDRGDVTDKQAINKVKRVITKECQIRFKTQSKPEPKKKDKFIFLKNSDLIDVAKKIKDSEIHDKTKCGLSVNGKCTGNFSPLKCDGLDVPEECEEMLNIKSKEFESLNKRSQNG